MHRFSIIAVVASASLVAVTGCGHPSASPASPTSPAASVQTLDEKATAVRIQATIYEVRIAPEKIGELDAAKLAATDFSRLPPELAESRALYQVDQQVSLAGDRVMVGSNEPMITNSRITDKGQKINSVQYNSVGAIFDFKAERVGPRQLQVTSNIEMSTKTDSPVEISPGVNTSVIRKATMSLKGAVELGKPSVLISADASSRDKDGKAIVYIARLVLGVGAPAGASGAN